MVNGFDPYRYAGCPQTDTGRLISRLPLDLDDAELFHSDSFAPRSTCSPPADEAVDVAEQIGSGRDPVNGRRATYMPMVVPPILPARSALHPIWLEGDAAGCCLPDSGRQAARKSNMYRPACPPTASRLPPSQRRKPAPLGDPSGGKSNQRQAQTRRDALIVKFRQELSEERCFQP